MKFVRLHTIPKDKPTVTPDPTPFYVNADHIVDFYRTADALGEYTVLDTIKDFYLVSETPLEIMSQTDREFLVRLSNKA